MNLNLELSAYQPCRSTLPLMFGREKYRNTWSKIHLNAYEKYNNRTDFKLLISILVMAMVIAKGGHGHRPFYTDLRSQKKLYGSNRGKTEVCGQKNRRFC